MYSCFIRVNIFAVYYASVWLYLFECKNVSKRDKDEILYEIHLNGLNHCTHNNSMCA